MTKKNKIFFILTLFLLLVNIVIAQNYDDYDWINDNLETADYLKIKDWSQVNQINIPLNRIGEVPAEKLDYSQLNSLQRMRMNSEQIEINFDNIKDLTKDVNKEKAQEAIRKKYSGLTVDLGNGAILKNGKLSATFGNKGNVPLSQVSKTTLVIIDKNGNVLLIEEKKPPKEGLYTAVYDEKTNIELDGKFISVKGELSHDKVKVGDDFSEVYVVKAEDELEFGDVKFLKTNNDVNLYINVPFDPDDHTEENYYYATDKEIIMHSTKSGKVKVEFLAGNEFFNMFERKYEKEGDNFIKDANGNPQFSLEPDKKDKLIIKVSNGDIIEAIDRKEQGIVPKLRHHSSENGFTVIEDGRLTFKFDEGKYSIVPPKPIAQNLEDVNGPYEFYNSRYESVPFEIESDINEFDQTLRINSANQFAVLDEKQKELVVYKFGFPISNSIETNAFQTVDQLRIKYPKIDFDVFVWAPDYYSVTPMSIQAIDYWLETNPLAQEKFGFVRFNDDPHMFAAAENILIFSEPYFDLYGKKQRQSTGYDIISHEFKHVLENEIRNNERETILSAIENHELPLELPQQEKIKNLLKDLKEINIQMHTSRIERGVVIPESLIDEEKEIRIQLKTILKDQDQRFQSFQSTLNNILVSSYEDLRENPEFLELIQMNIIALKSQGDKEFAIEKLNEFIEKKQLPTYLIKLYTGSRTTPLPEYEILEQWVEKNYGIPSFYTFTDRASKKEQAEGFFEFHEISSSVFERRNDQIIRVANEQNEQGEFSQRAKFNRAIIQANFDADMNIDATEYQTFMNIQCKSTNCLENKCKTYKFLCCQKYLASPNC